MLSSGSHRSGIRADVDLVTWPQLEWKTFRTNFSFVKNNNNKIIYKNPRSLILDYCYSLSHLLHHCVLILLPQLLLQYTISYLGEVISRTHGFKTLISSTSFFKAEDANRKQTYMMSFCRTLQIGTTYVRAFFMSIDNICLLFYVVILKLTLNNLVEV